jgi:hypothetical protein
MVFSVPIYHSPFTNLLPTRLAIASATTAAAEATAAATTTAATAVAAVTTTAAATTIATIFAWSCLIDGQIATVQVSTIELLDCLFAFFLGSHLDEPESA